MSSPRIIRVPILPLSIVNAHIIRGQEGCILIDTGIPASEHKIRKVLETHGLSFADIRLIIVTHAHTDHAGSAARLRQLSGAPILAHRGDADFYSRNAPQLSSLSGPIAAGASAHRTIAFRPDRLTVRFQKKPNVVKLRRTKTIARTCAACRTKAGLCPTSFTSPGGSIASPRVSRSAKNRVRHMFCR